ncbi:MAG: ComF family protein [Candidatus Wildermuthbacteria bacterium]|nr:ComF family protein [Candidatus Wildermuthbacteria bacterium]
MMKVLEKIKNGVLDVLFPALCGGCGKEGRYVCERCELFLGEAPLICPVCDGASFSGARHLSCQNSRYGLDGLVSTWEYEGMVKHLLGQVKYKRISHIVQELVSRSFRTMTNDQKRFADFLSFVFSKNVVLAFVPSYIRKEKERGFNQARLIMKEIEKLAGIHGTQLLKKIRETRPQMELDREQRLKNLGGAFQIVFPVEQRPENVVLLDDIWTTGATMKECCKELKKGGVEKVWGFTLARTV